MKKKYFQSIFVFMLILTSIIPNLVFSQTSSSEDYTIKDYHIDMIVKEDNTFEITEKITAYFQVPKHGIFRKIPLRNSITRLDGTKSNNRAKISNIYVSEDYETYKEDGYEVIKIGKAGETLTGSHSYTIKYHYNIGKDPLKNADELYFNLIGNEWDTKISNVDFKITLPKSFDKSLLGFSSGEKGSIYSNNVSYTVEQNTISGSLANTLEVGQSLTVRLTLPEGYFVGTSSNIEGYCMFAIIGSLLCVLIAYVLWIKFGKDDEVIQTVEFYPPKGYNSAEIGFLYKGVAGNEEVLSLLVYLADKGYLKIEENGKSFKITKLKEYDGKNENEKIFLEGLFKKFQFVVKSDLYNQFYKTLDKIKENLNSKENKNKIWEPKSNAKRKWLVMMVIAIFVIITIKPVLEYANITTWIFALLFTGIGFSVGLSFLLEKGSIFSKIFGVIICLTFGGIPWYELIYPSLKGETIYLITYVVGFISIAILIFLIKKMPKRTPYGNEMLGKIKGFKRFLETAQKEQLENLVGQNPEYFYHILPYTYALGVSKIWVEQFETIAMQAQAPNWYSSSTPFSMRTFENFIGDTMDTAKSRMNDSSSSGTTGSTSRRRIFRRRFWRAVEEVLGNFYYL